MLSEKVASVKESIEKVCAEYGIEPHSVEVLAATKTVPPEIINRLPALGIVHAGENRVQEFVEKRGSVNGIVWDFIGALQTNKAKQVVGRTRLIHSLDRVSLADEIDRLSEKSGITTQALIEVNVGGEASKSGISVNDLDGFYDYCLAKKHLKVRGLMSVLPIGADERLYEKLYGLFSKRKSKEFDILSAGMSGDYLTAIKHGANLVRLGSIIFGKRA